MVIETGMDGSIGSVMVLLSGVGHELRIWMHFAVGIVALVFAEVGRHVFPAPAGVAHLFPAVVVGSAASYIHLPSEDQLNISESTQKSKPLELRDRRKKDRKCLQDN